MRLSLTKQIRATGPLVLVGEASQLGRKSVSRCIELSAPCLDRLDFASKGFTRDCSLTVDAASSSSSSASSSGAKHRHLRLAVLKPQGSRNLGIIRTDLIPGIVRAAVSGADADADEPLSIVFLLKEAKEAMAVAASVARAIPRYNLKSSADVQKAADRPLEVIFQLPDDSSASSSDNTIDLDRASMLAERVAQVAELVDSAPTDLNPAAYTERIKALVADVANIKAEIIIGDDLKSKGLHMLHGVGKAAIEPPRLIVLEYNGGDSASAESVALVGKGITYDTGGLSLKTGAGMPGMKTDMGGSAGVLGAFLHLAETNCPGRLVAALAIAENAIGPKSLKNDDVVRGYSGKTVEINNTDAEGRLVLGDAVAYVAKHYNPKVLIDMATLTGAQLVTTGLQHAAVLTPDEEFERKILAAGRLSGDLCYPMLYCPELLMDMFKSEVADMKNSVSDRANAQSSCAGHFVEAHLPTAYAEKFQWAHIDIAGPSALKNWRATGFGVALLAELVRSL